MICLSKERMFAWVHVFCSIIPGISSTHDRITIHKLRVIYHDSGALGSVAREGLGEFEDIISLDAS